MDDILFERRGAAGLITLNRPKVLNALNSKMILALRRVLDAWAVDDSVGVVVVRGEGERAFCAGGDIRAFYESAVARDTVAREFWRAEYSLIDTIKRYPKPYLALMHGIAMGGGLGISVNGAYRVASDSLVCAMPETGIGFYPDVGASAFLPRMPGECGLYLALTGNRIKCDDAFYLGVATHVLAQKKWPDLIEALASGDSIGDLLRQARTGARARAAAAPLAQIRPTIDAAFSASSVEEILARLDTTDGAFARETAAMMRLRSPTSLKVAFLAQRSGRTLSFADCMRMEFRLSANIQKLPDFAEGIRAKIIDKDDKPIWQPGRLADVPAATIAGCFASLGAEDLVL